MKLVLIIALLLCGHSSNAQTRLFSGSSNNAYPASVVQNGLQAVYNIPASVGPRRTDYKVAGVDALPTNCSVISAGGENYVLCTGNASFGASNGSVQGWDFSAMGGVIVRGNSTVVTIYDSLWVAGTCGARTNTYGLQVSDNGTTPTVTVGYSKFDGQKCNTSVGVSGPWSGATLYVLSGASLTIDHVLLTGIGYDPSKCSNATFVQTNSYIQAYGWNLNADADAPQLISCNFTATGNLYDISDGSALALAHNFPGTPANSAIFNTIDTGSTQNSTQTVSNNIFYGYGRYGTTCCTNTNAPANGLPFNVLSVCDNHTNTGSGLTLSGSWTNNVIQKGNNNYYTNGGTLTSAACISAWTTNIDYDTAATIASPSF